MAADMAGLYSRASLFAIQFGHQQVGLEQEPARLNRRWSQRDAGVCVIPLWLNGARCFNLLNGKGLDGVDEDSLYCQVFSRGHSVWQKKGGSKRTMLHDKHAAPRIRNTVQNDVAVAGASVQPKCAVGVPRHEVAAANSGALTAVADTEDQNECKLDQSQSEAVEVAAVCGEVVLPISDAVHQSEGSSEPSRVSTLENPPPSGVEAKQDLDQGAGQPTILRTRIPQMYVVQITPELAAVAKVGGLADVVFGLSRELEWRGNTVETILPKYDCMRYDQISGLSPCFNDLWVPWYNGHVHCTVYSGSVHGRHAFFIESHSRENFFSRNCFYGSNDDIYRFAFFSRAAMEFLYKSGKHPEIIHCHDWQTGLVPVFLYEIYQQLGMGRSRVCYTVHNFRHQGVTGTQLLNAVGLWDHGRISHPDRLRDPRHASAVNLMKGGIVYSNFVTTVSSRHATEARHDQGFGLEQVLQVHQGKFGGVLNGIDGSVWNPEIDRHIPRQYSVQTLDDKYENKRALRHRFWLSDNAKPIIAFVGRLDEQKGLELLRHAAFSALASGAQFVLLGSAPDHRVDHQFWQLKRELNDSPDCHIELGFHDELAHLIYAGADMMLVPSRYEPCGLTQLIALKYGTVPIVRSVGGLVDSVFDKDYDFRAQDQRNGYVFDHYDPKAIDNTFARAISCYYEYPEHFRNLILNGMRADHSWNYPAQHYLNIYDLVRVK